MNKLSVFAGVAVLAGSAFAADQYYWHDTTGDHDLANRLNWTKNDQTTVPDTFPPPLDTATSGSTHPVLNFKGKGGTLAISNNTELALQDMDFSQDTVDTNWLIDLGAKSKTLKLFGDQNAAMWVGQNTPDGQRVTLKRGTITRVQSSQRKTNIRLGAGATSGKRLSYFRIDGPEATVQDMAVNVDSRDCEFCVTNGGTMKAVGKNALVMAQRCSGSRYRISGAGSLMWSNCASEEKFFFGDAITHPDKTSGGIEITDGGAVSKLPGVIGNRAGNFYVFMDNGSWTNAASIVLGASGDNTSTNNSFHARNNSTVSLSGTFYVGQYGGYSRAVITNSALFKASSVSLGNYSRGTKTVAGDTVGYGHNAMTLVDTPFDVLDFYVGGNAANFADGPNAYNNTLEIRNCEIQRAYMNLYLGLNRGGTNSAVLADSTYPLGTVSLGRNGAAAGFNTLLVTNAVVKGSFEVGGQEGTSGYGTSGNVVRFVDSAVGMGPGYTAVFSIGGSGANAPSRSNVVEFVHSTWTNSSTYCAISGWNGNTRGNDYNAMIADDRSYVVSTNGSDGVRVGGHGFHNRLEVKNGSTFLANSIMLGQTGGNYAYTGTNVLYVGKDALVDKASYFQLCPGGNIVIVEDGTLKANYLRLHYYYSEAQGKTIDGMVDAETEYGKPAKEIWGSRFVFRGTKPVMRIPANDATSGAISGCQFDRSTYVEFEFPAAPYEHGVLQSSYKVGFSAGTNYRFDCSKIAAGANNWSVYPLAEVDATGAIEFGTGELANMTTALQAAAKAAGLKAKLALSSDGKKLLASFHKVKGLTVVIR